MALLKEYDGQIVAAGGQERGSTGQAHLISWAFWFTLLQEDEGQVQAADGQEQAG